MSATPEQIAIDEKALEAAARALSELHIEASLEKGSGWRVAAHRGARAAITAYLSATSDAQAERVRVLESALKLINEMDGEYQPARSDWDMLRIAQAALKAAP